MYIRIPFLGFLSRAANLLGGRRDGMWEEDERLEREKISCERGVRLQCCGSKELSFLAGGGAILGS